MVKDLKLRESAIKKVLYITLGLNWLVALVKIIAGHQFGYFSLSSSGLESFFDGSANILALLSITLASKPADDDHNYGHHKFETLGSFVIAGLLFYSAFQISADLYEMRTNPQTHATFGIIPILAIVLSMGVSFFVSWYERKKGEEYGSSILLADADHTYGDFIVSIGVLGSIIASYFGLKWPDYVIGAVVCLYMFWLAISIIKKNLPDLLDGAPEISKEIIAEIEKVEYVVDVHNFRCRGNQNWIHVDFHMHLDPKLTLLEAHRVSKDVEKLTENILKTYSKYVDVLIHFEPYEESEHENN